MIKKMLLKSLRKKNVGDKMAFSFGVILVSLGICLVIAIVGLLFVSSNLETFYRTSYNNVALVHSGYGDLQEMTQNLLHSCFVNDSTRINARIQLGKRALERLEEQLSSLEQSSYAPAEIFSILEENRLIIVSSLEEFEATMKDKKNKNRQQEAMAIYDTKMFDCISEMSYQFTELEEIETEHASKMYKTSEIIKYICIAILVLIGAISVILGRIIAKVISGSMSGSVVELKVASAKMADGDFDIDIEGNTKDEFGELADSMRDMIETTSIIISDMGDKLGAMAKGDFTEKDGMEEKYVGIYSSLRESMEELRQSLCETVRDIRDVSIKVNGRALKLEENAQSLADGAASQAGEIKELTYSVDNVNNVAKKNAETAMAATSDMAEILNQAESGRQEILHIVEAMERINETSEKISHIIGDMEDIADQTSFLSLNASIEAARAGELGKGFSVVATQIGRLASDSAGYAENSKKLIDKSLEEVENGNEITANTASMLGKVLNSINNILEITESLSKASISQADMLREVSVGIDKVSAVVQNNSYTAMETSAASEELTEQSRKLNKMMARFLISKEDLPSEDISQKEQSDEDSKREGFEELIDEDSPKEEFEELIGEDSPQDGVEELPDEDSGE